MMNITKYSSHCFFENVNGIRFDDAYDIIKRKAYIKYVAEHHINYLHSQDDDMLNVTYFPDIEYLTVPDDAENLEALYSLRNLKGIELRAKQLRTICLSNFPQLTHLSIGDGQAQDMSEIAKISTLTHLYCQQWKLENLCSFTGFDKLEVLVLNFCGRLKRLTGLEQLTSLNGLRIEYCLKLVDIDAIITLAKTLKSLRIMDCNKVNSYDGIQALVGLEKLQLFTSQTSVKNYLQSLDFISKLKRLKSFYTNYRIVNGDMTPLLGIEDAVRDKS